MELSYALAKIMGMVVSAFALASLIRPSIIRDAIRDFDHESFARLVIGCIAVGAGVAIVLVHNVWEEDFRIVITLFGWTMLLKGAAYLIAPKMMVTFTKSMLKSRGQMQIFLLACLALGLYLVWHGFGF